MSLASRVNGRSRSRRNQRGAFHTRLRGESLERRALLANDVVISEIMADNATTLADQDGEFSD
jgi:hypothetical protein